MNGLRRDGLKSPVYHAILIVLFSVGLAALPIDYIFNLFGLSALTSRLLGGTVLRLALFFAALFFIKKYRFHKALFSFNGVKSLLYALPALLVAVCNFPFLSAISGKLSFEAGAADIVLFVLYCVSVGLFEEAAFRGLVFPLLLYALRKRKRKVFWAAAVSAAMFGASHLMNLFGGAGVGETFLQAGYSFLVGAMFAIIIACTHNLFAAAFLHAAFDIGGLLTSASVGIAAGVQWDTVSIIIFAFISVYTFFHMIFLSGKFDDESLFSLYFSDENERR